MIAEKIKATQGISVALRAPSLPRGEASSKGDPHRPAPAAAPDPEVPAKAARRRFTADYKLRILKLADACTEPGSLGALLRQEGLYSTNLATWRRQRDEGTLSALTPKKRGRKGNGRGAPPPPFAGEGGIKPACDALDIPRSGFYRREARKNAPPAEPKKCPIPPRALSSDERQGGLDILHSARVAAPGAP